MNQKIVVIGILMFIVGILLFQFSISISQDLIPGLRPEYVWMAVVLLGLILTYFGMSSD